MRKRYHAWAFLPFLALSSCMSFQINQHVAAENVPPSPQRLLVVARNGLAPSLADAISARFRECGVTVLALKSNPTELNPEEKATAAIAAFKPDSILFIQPTVVGVGRTEVFRLYSVTAKRDAWKASIGIRGGGSNSMKPELAEKLANGVVQTMTDDRVLAACAAPSRAGT